MIHKEEDTRRQTALEAAKAMMAAARTAPKGRGLDSLEIVTLEGDDLKKLAAYMRKVWERCKMDLFMRDAGNVENSEAVVLIGTKISVVGLNCGFCGFDTCEAKAAHKKVPCAFNVTDLGIAVGSAVSVASTWRIDNRVMYSVGFAALEMGLLPDCHIAYGIPLSCTSKSPFFDRAHNPAPEK